MRMLEPVTNLGKALLYYIIAFGLCLGLTALSPSIGRRTPDIAMFTPLAAVLLMLFVFTRDGFSKDCRYALGLHRAGVDGWGLAFAVPLFVLGFAYGPSPVPEICSMRKPFLPRRAIFIAGIKAWMPHDSRTITSPMQTTI